jgi:hypothetical protein
MWRSAGARPGGQARNCSRTDGIRAGVIDVALSPLAFDIARTRVGFYHGEDRAAAEALAALLADPEGAVPPLRDDGALVPRPPQGTIDLWIAG